jgi:ATPase subunit of ABC transporter with duplicated ATPase domains
MLDFRGISVHYGHQDVLTGVSFRVNKGDRIGVVGPNGSGKSTLFKIILGEMATDTGELIIELNPRIGFTRQNPEPDTPDETLLEYSLRGIPGLSEMEEEMHELEADLTDPSKMKRYGELQMKFEHLGGYDIETRVKVALGGLGFTTEEFN